jgi:uncharacterized membrane protein YgcG
VAPRLRNAPNKTRLFGSAHWLYTAEQFSLVGRFDPMEVEPDLGDAKADLLSLFNETRALRVTVKTRNRARLADPVPDLLGSLPDRETCDGLLEAYLRTFEPMYRIMHVPTLRRDYARFWEERAAAAEGGGGGSSSSRGERGGGGGGGGGGAGAAPPLPTHFYMKLVTIFAIGATFWATGDDAESRRLRAVAPRWVYAAQWWLTGPTEKDSMNMDGLQLACLVLLARRSTWNGPGGNGPGSSSGALLSMALSMGLHRDAALFPNLCVFVREMRARLWVTVLELCVQTSLDGATPLMAADDYDARLPLNLNDEDIEPGQREEPAEREGLTDCSLLVLQAASLRLRMEIQRRLDGLVPPVKGGGGGGGGERDADSGPSPTAYDVALELGHRMKGACRDVAAFFRKHAAVVRQQEQQQEQQQQQQQQHSTAASGAALSDRLVPRDFHRRLIDIAFRRYVLLLHRPFMVEARRDPRYYYARKVCVESATIMATYARDLQSSVNAAAGVASSAAAGAPPSSSSLTPSARDLSQLAVVGHGIFKGPLSMDAIAILCLEMITQLEEHHQQNVSLSPPLPPKPPSSSAAAADGGDSGGLPPPTLDPGDALDELYRSQRASLVAVLDTVQDRLLGLIERGGASLKRFGYTAALLAQIRAMESGQPSIRRAVYNALMECLGKAHALLQAGLDDAVGRDEDADAEGEGGSSSSSGGLASGGDVFVGQASQHQSQHQQGHSHQHSHHHALQQHHHALQQQHHQQQLQHALAHSLSGSSQQQQQQQQQAAAASFFGGGEDMFAMFDFPIDMTASWGSFVPQWNNWWPSGFSMGQQQQQQQGGQGGQGPA